KEPALESGGSEDETLLRDRTIRMSVRPVAKSNQVEGSGTIACGSASFLDFLRSIEPTPRLRTLKLRDFFLFDAAPWSRKGQGLPNQCIHTFYARFSSTASLSQSHTLQPLSGNAARWRCSSRRDSATSFPSRGWASSPSNGPNPCGSKE